MFLKGTFFINFLFETVLCNIQASRIYMQEECLSSLFMMINHAWKKHPFWMLHMSCYVVFLVLLFFFVQLNVKEVAFLKFHSIVILRIFTFCLFIFLCVFLIFFLGLGLSLNCCQQHKWICPIFEHLIASYLMKFV